MPIKVRCPSCSDAFKTSSKNRGRKVDCPICSASIRVSKRSRKKRESGDSEGWSFTDEIAAVLAEGDGLPREFVPSVLDGDEPEVFDAEDSAIGGGPNSVGSEAAAPTAAGPLSPDVTYDALIVPKPGEGGPSSGFDARRAAPPFLVGMVIGAVLASAAWAVLSSGAQPVAATPKRPVPTKPEGPVKVVSGIAPEAPPESDDEKSELLARLSVTSAKFETGGGLLGGGRTLEFGVRNESGLVLRKVTVAATLSLAAFSDSVIAEEQVTVPFSPVLGVGEEQVVRVAAPSGGQLASAKLAGPVRLKGKVVDVQWQSGNDI